MNALARLLMGGLGFVAYVGVGGALLVHALSSKLDEAAATPSAEMAAIPTTVTINISVVDGYAVECQTTTNRVSADTILVPAADLVRVSHDLGCQSRMEP